MTSKELLERLMKKAAKQLTSKEEIEKLSARIAEKR